MADKVSFSTSRNSGQEEVSRASEDVSSPDTGSVDFSTSRNAGTSQSASDAASASGGDSVDISSAGGPVNFSTSRNANTQQPASDATSVSSENNVAASSADSQATSTDSAGGPVNISTSRNAATEQPTSGETASSATESVAASSNDSQATSTDTTGGTVDISTSRNTTTQQPASEDTAPSATENVTASGADSQDSGTDTAGGPVNISTSRNAATEPTSDDAEPASDDTAASTTENAATSSADSQDSSTDTIDVSTSRNNTNSTGTELSTASDTIGADSDGLEKLLTGLTQFCENLAQAIDKFMPEASDERFQELENGVLKDTGITAQNIIDTAQGVSTFLRGLAEISEEAVNDLDAIDTPSSTSTSATKDNVSFNMDDVIDHEDDETTDTETATQEDTEVEAASAEESADTAETDDTTGGETTFSTSRNGAQAAAETADLNTESATATAEQATQGRHLSDDTATNTTPDSTETSADTDGTPLKAQAAAETSLSAESGTPANHVPDSSPVATSGPTKSAGDVINTPDSGPARDVLRSNAPAIKETYPDVPISDAKQKQIAAELMGQNSGTGSKQPVDTIHLTDQQVRTLAEAIAHNINLRRQAMAEQMMSQIDMGSVDSFGGGGAGFQAGELSNDYQQAVVELAEQIVGTQPPIPYAWGGGTLEGPSQGISDGGGYADACGDYNKIGFDCSGLVRYMFYQLTGVELPRVSQAQFEYCQPISDPMPGDIGFPAGGSPGHVFMYVGNGEIIEAQQSGTVMMFSPADASYVWGRPPESPNWDV